MIYFKIRRLLLIGLFCLVYQVDAQETADSVKTLTGLTVAQYKQLTERPGYPVLVNFSADWCVICKRQKPVLDDLNKRQPVKFELVEIDMENNPLIAEYFEVDGLPVNIIYNNGVLVWDRLGFQSGEQLEGMLKAVTVLNK